MAGTYSCLHPAYTMGCARSVYLPQLTPHAPTCKHARSFRLLARCCAHPPPPRCCRMQGGGLSLPPEMTPAQLRAACEKAEAAAQAAAGGSGPPPPVHNLLSVASELLDGPAGAQLAPATRTPAAFLAACAPLLRLGQLTRADVAAAAGSSAYAPAAADLQFLLAALPRAAQQLPAPGLAAWCASTCGAAAVSALTLQLCRTRRSGPMRELGAALLRLVGAKGAGTGGAGAGGAAGVEEVAWAAFGGRRGIGASPVVAMCSSVRTSEQQLLGSNGGDGGSGTAAGEAPDPLSGSYDDGDVPLGSPPPVPQDDEDWG
eukprot:254171-Chlamydomonas_euryale.AAC.1